jgi:hypothetical protein
VCSLGQQPQLPQGHCVRESSELCVSLFEQILLVRNCGQIGHPRSLTGQRLLARLPTETTNYTHMSAAASQAAILSMQIVRPDAHPRCFPGGLCLTRSLIEACSSSSRVGGEPGRTGRPPCGNGYVRAMLVVGHTTSRPPVGVVPSSEHSPGCLFQ